jgi:Replication initiation factor
MKVSSVPVRSLGVGFASEETPFGNTVLDSHTDAVRYGVDWITCIMKTTIHELIDLLDFVSGSLTDVWIYDKDHPHFIGRPFAHCIHSARGGVAAWNGLDGGGVDLLLSLNGNALGGAYDLRSVLRITSYLEHIGGKFTRFDINMDSNSNWFRGIRNLIDEARENKQQKGFEKIRWQVEKSRKGTFRTLYMGTRKSDKLHRIYDKDGYVRWELESKNEISQKIVALSVQAFRTLAPTDNFGDVIGGLIRDTILGSVDFIERKGKNLCRARRLDWWESFLEFMKGSPISIRRDKRKRLLEKTMRWIERAVMPSLAVIRSCNAGMFFDWIRNGINQSSKLMGDHACGRILVEQWEPEGLEALFVGRFDVEHNCFSY